MKVTRGFINELEERASSADGDPNPEKLSECVFEKWEIDYLLDALNETFELTGHSKRVFPRRIGKDPRKSKDSAGIGIMRNGKLIIDPPELFTSSDGFELIEEPAGGIMEDGPHLFELWVVQFGTRTDIELENGVFYRMVAEGYHDIFDGTLLEEMFGEPS